MCCSEWLECLSCSYTEFFSSATFIFIIIYPIDNTAEEWPANFSSALDDVVNIIMRHDIFAIIESWLDPGEVVPKIDGYTSIRSDRKKNSKAKRTSGGLIIYYKNNISSGIEKIASKLNDSIWLKLDRLYFGLDKDLYICVLYIPPVSSTYFNPAISELDHFDVLSNEIECYAALGDIAIVGDLNSRVGPRLDYGSLWCNARR